jgi:hypothetical protein
MATLEQIGAALKAADAAGNVDDAKRLAAAYRQMQAGAQTGAPRVQTLQGKVGKMDPAQAGVSENVQGLPAQDAYGFELNRMRRTYYPQLSDEQWQAAINDPITNLKPADAPGLLNDGLTMGLSDEARGAAGFMTALTSGKDPGQGFADFQRFEQARRAAGADSAGALGVAAQFGGGMLAGRPDMAAASVASKLPAWVKGGMDAAKQGAVFGFAATEGDLGDRASGALMGAGMGAGLGSVVPWVGGKIGKKATEAAQRKATDVAIKGAPTGDALRNAGSQLFEASTGGTAPAVVPASYDRFMSKIQGALAKFRPNAANDPQAVGLLQHLEALRAAANTPGTVLDFKDLHLARQLAQKVLKSPSGRDTAIAKIVVDQIDDFITRLKPADILGAADPTQAANDLMKGISTWARAERVGLIEQALKDADTYKSGLANGIKLSFERLRKSADFAKFSAAEQAAIRQVAKGTTTQNIAELFGKLGFSLGGSAAHNIVGGSLGTAGLTTVLTPVLGPAAMPVAFAATTAAGAAGRNVSERLAVRGVDRAAQIAATPNIPRVSPANTQGVEEFMRSLIRGGQGLRAE